MKVPKNNKVSRNVTSTCETNPPQETQAVLELEFPGLDTALIAAILADHHDAADARNVLIALC